MPKGPQGQKRPADVTTTNWRRHITIRDLDVIDVEVLRPINVVLTEKDGDVIAEFEEANIAVSEDSVTKALVWLKSSIVDLFKTYNESRDILGPFAEQQLNTLERYVGQVPNPEG